MPVAHDSSGMTSLNCALAHPAGVDSVLMLNSAYAEDRAIVWPEMVTLFATRSLGALAMAIAESPEQFGWLLKWQQQKFFYALPEAQKPHFQAFLGRLISQNFLDPPSSGPAFMQLAAQFFEALTQNASRLPELKSLDVPVKLILGTIRSLHHRDRSRTAEVSAEACFPNCRAGRSLAPDRRAPANGERDALRSLGDSREVGRSQRSRSRC